MIRFFSQWNFFLKLIDPTFPVIQDKCVNKASVSQVNPFLRCFWIWGVYFGFSLDWLLSTRFIQRNYYCLLSNSGLILAVGNISSRGAESSRSSSLFLLSYFLSVLLLTGTSFRERYALSLQVSAVACVIFLRVYLEISHICPLLCVVFRWSSCFE